MTAREVVKAIKANGGKVLRQRGSHAFYECACGKHHTTVPMHKGTDIKSGTLRGIEKDMEACFGKGWLTGGA